MSSKQCFKCGLALPLESFYKHKKMSDGHLNKCKDCTKNDARSRRYGPLREKVLAYDRERSKTPQRKAHIAEMVRRFKERSPERRRAQVLLGSAVKCRRVIPWPVCALPECDAKPEAHHPDYSQPLQVVWLRPSHHKQAHAIVKTYYAESANSP